MQSGIFLVRYRNKIMDAGMSMPMPSYAQHTMTTSPVKPAIW
jgi:hypothetical protein